MDAASEDKTRLGQAPVIGQSKEPSTSDRFPLFSPPKISAPKGGGSIRPVDGKFGVNASSGSGAYHIPVPTTKSRHDFGPSLSLSYNSLGANSAFGLGWQLTAGSISRKTDKGWPRYRDGEGEDDVFVLTGAEDLVPKVKKDPVSGSLLKDRTGKYVLEELERDGYVVRQYLPRVEGSFSRIERWTRAEDPDDIHWKITSGANLITVYGRDDSSRICSAPGQKSKRIFSWLACETYDLKGSSIWYRYKRESSENVAINDSHELNRTDQDRSRNLYLKSVHYGNKTPNRGADFGSITPASQIPLTDWMFSVVLDYGEHDAENPTPVEVRLWACRPDPFSVYHGTFEVRTYRLCQRIIMFHHFPEELQMANVPVGWTSLGYRSGPKLTMLTSVTQTYCNVDGKLVRSKTVPPLLLEYTEPAEVGTAMPREVDVESLQNVCGALGANYQLVDLLGEGLPGILTEDKQQWWYKPNRSPNNQIADASGVATIARFSEQASVIPKPNATLGSGSAFFMDINRDGQPELFVNSWGSAGYYSREDDGSWRDFASCPTFPNVSLVDPNVKFLDLTGDGLPDILVTEDHVFTLYAQAENHGFGDGEQITVCRDEEKGPRILLEDSQTTIAFAHMSGSALPDLVRVRNQDVSYWPSLSRGMFGARVAMSNTPTFDRDCDFNTRRLHLADIDGSGTDDIVYVGETGATVYYNQAGNAWSPAVPVTYFPPWDDVATVGVLDLLGTGTACLVWSTPLPHGLNRSLRYIDLMDAKKPHLLSKIINNRGLEIDVQYSPSTKFYLQDIEEGNGWATKLAFPVHCVERQVVVDRIMNTRYSTRYRYHEGFYDAYEREFRGFGMVEKWDVDDSLGDDSSNHQNTDPAFATPPTKTKVWYHTGFSSDRLCISNHLSAQYYRPPPGSPGSNLTWMLPPTVLPDISLTGSEILSAYRCLKTSVLRTEVYADDGSSLKEVPYQIVEQNYDLVLVQFEQSYLAPAVFWCHPRETVTYHLERNPADPRIQQALTLEVDAFGNTLRSASVSYGRQKGLSELEAKWKSRQEMTFVTYARKLFTGLIDDGNVRANPMPYAESSYELLNLPRKGSLFTLADFDLFDQMEEVPYYAPASPVTSQKRLLSRSEDYFRSNDLSRRLELGVIESLGLASESFMLAMSKTQLDSAFVDENGNKIFPDLIPVLKSAGPGGGGYVDIHNDGNLWLPSGTFSFSPDPDATASAELESALSLFFTPVRFTSQLGHVTVVEYDKFALVPRKVTDNLGLTYRAEYDYVTISPSVVTDPNGNQTHAAFDEYGVLTGSAISGKLGEDVGDSIMGFRTFRSDDEIKDFFQDPTQAKAMDFLGTATECSFGTYWSYVRDGSPLYSFRLTRETHAAESSPGHVHISFQFLDGFGRTVQSKMVSEPGPLRAGEPSVDSRWIASGTVIYNNKGKIVRQYEPFFDSNNKPHPTNRAGASSIMFYDPLQREIGKLFPDRTWQKAVLTPWKNEAWDVADTIAVDDPATDTDVGICFRRLGDKSLYLPSWYQTRKDGQLGRWEREAAEKSYRHANTPLVNAFDALGRSFLSVADNGSAGKYTSASDQDIEGRVLATYDAYGRKVSVNQYTAHGELIRQVDMDSGSRYSIGDIEGRPLWSQNSRGVRTRHVYDAIGRETEVLSQLQPGGPEMAIHRNVYGDSVPDSEARNLKDKLYQVFDQAGVVTSEAYDFKGNCLRTTRRLCSSYKTIDWSKEPPLEDTAYAAETTYNAMNKIVTQTHNDQSVVHYSYNLGGLLEAVELQLRGETSNGLPVFRPYVTEIQYNARGQRTMMNFGNGSSKAIEFDPSTFRKVSMVTSRGSAAIQALYFTYDIGGLVSHLQDDAQQSLFMRGSKIDPSQDYSYDAIGRLVQASGREHLGQTNGQPYSPSKTWDATPYQPGDGTALAAYVETYKYDNAGNIHQMAHAGSDSRAPGWTRRYEYTKRSAIDPSIFGNRLTRTTVGNTADVYQYDGPDGLNGLLTSMPSTPLMTWDFLDRLQSSSKQRSNGTATPETTWYVYDSLGTRVRKVVVSQASEGEEPHRMKETIYLQGLEIFRKFDNDGNMANFERQTVRLTDGSADVATIETRVAGEEPGVPAQLVRYQLSNQLHSVCVELNEAGEVVSREEYSPYGSTVYQCAATIKRHRFSGKELDAETGLYFFGARYYAHWIGRWISPDPGGYGDGHNLYVYVRCNPIGLVDKSGASGEDENGQGWFDRARASVRQAIDSNPVSKGLARGFNDAMEANFGSPEKFGKFLTMVALGTAVAVAAPELATALAIVYVGKVLIDLGGMALDYAQHSNDSQDAKDARKEEMARYVGREGTEFLLYMGASKIGGGGGRILGEMVDKAAGQLVAGELAAAGAGGGAPRINPGSLAAAEGEATTSMMASSGNKSGGGGGGKAKAPSKPAPPKKPPVQPPKITIERGSSVRTSSGDENLVRRFTGAMENAGAALKAGDADAIKARLPKEQRDRVDIALDPNAPMKVRAKELGNVLQLLVAHAVQSSSIMRQRIQYVGETPGGKIWRGMREMRMDFVIELESGRKLKVEITTVEAWKSHVRRWDTGFQVNSNTVLGFTYSVKEIAP